MDTGHDHNIIVEDRINNTDGVVNIFIIILYPRIKLTVLK